MSRFAYFTRIIQVSVLQNGLHQEKIFSLVYTEYFLFTSEFVRIVVSETNPFSAVLMSVYIN